MIKTFLLDDANDKRNHFIYIITLNNKQVLNVTLLYFHIRNLYRIWLNYNHYVFVEIPRRYVAIAERKYVVIISVAIANTCTQWNVKL